MLILEDQMRRLGVCRDAPPHNAGSPRTSKSRRTLRAVAAVKMKPERLYFKGLSAAVRAMILAAS
jgi:hypothetical protein